MAPNALKLIWDGLNDDPVQLEEMMTIYCI